MMSFTNEPIAVIGSGCRFPGGSSSPSKLWDLLSHPRDVLSEIPRSRFDPRGFYNPDGNYNGHSNVLHSYVLDEDHRVWDADFFSVSANEALAIDPQQRLLMETVYEALEAGGQRLRDLRGSNTAVYVGLMGEEYSAIQGRELNTLPTYMATGVARSIVSNRISYFFGWHGPSMTIDTACSSSLVAVHQAVQALRAGTSRVAVAAGTNLLLSMEPYITESTFHMLSPRGRSHMWDVDADGYGRGDGVATTVLKRLSDAVADGDAIECVIRETGVNQDGRTNGITAPSADAQFDLIQDTYRRAGLDLNSSSGRPQFFEAHGTGTPAGDPIEAEAIHNAIGKHLGGGRDKLYVGSIKTIVGHTEGTAGIAALMKVSLALQHGSIPANMLFNQLNPAIGQFYEGLQVPVDAGLPWPPTDRQPRRASVNSFGFGGTNAHAIVEAYDQPPPTIEPAGRRSSYVGTYTFSAASKASLKRVLQNTVAFLEETSDIPSHDLAYTLNARRSAFSFRAAYFARNVSELRDRLQDSLALPDWDTAAVTHHQPSAPPMRILGIFTGQGAQWAGMGKQLFDDFPFAHSRILELETALATLPASDRPSWSLLAELKADGSKSRLHLAEFSQPLCTALQIVLVDLLAAANVRFSAVVGHSSGEIAAAYAAGFLSARDAIVVAYYRGLHTNLAKGERGQKGAMLAVGTSPEDAQEMISLPQFDGRISLAACNSPTSVSLSGDADVIDEAKVAFEDEGKFVRTLRVDKAYHSHHLQPCSAPYVESLRRASVDTAAAMPRKGCKWYSSVFDGALITGDSAEELNATYWARNMTQTVLFSSAIEHAVADGNSFTMAVEAGPHGALKGPAKETIESYRKPISVYISSLSRNADSSEVFCDAVGQVWANAPEGAVDLEKFEITVHGPAGPRGKLLKNLPIYPWDNQRTFWHESRRSRALRLRPEPGHLLLGTLTPDSNDTDMAWDNVLRVPDLPWLSGHQLQGQTVFPAAGYVALAVEAAQHLARRTASASARMIELEDLAIGRAIAFESESAAVETTFSLHVESTTKRHNEGVIIVASFQSRSPVGNAVETSLNASGRLRVTVEEEDSTLVKHQVLLPGRQVTASSRMVDVNEDEFYSELKKLGYNYSGRFRALESMKRKIGYGHGRISKGSPSLSDKHPSEKQLLVHPGFLDAAFQATFLAYSWPGDHQLWSLHVPVSIRSIRIDAAQSRANADSYLGFDSTITGHGIVDGQPGIVADVDIFPDNKSQAMIQIEGIRVVPFAAGTEEQDAPLFYVNAWGPANPDAELAVGADRASPEELELARLLERMALFYLRRLNDDIKPHEAAQAAWHHQKLVDYASRSVKRETDIKNECFSDTAETLGPLMDAYGDTIDVRLMRSVGECLAQAVRGETNILELMQQDGMLDRWYTESLGLRQHANFLTEIIGQIAHVNPHMRILEIAAGKGPITKRILSKIGDAFDQYMFTDISPDSVETAKASFSEDSARIHFQPLDPEQDVVAQGFQKQSYQLVIATLACHYTEGINVTLRNARELLEPGGYLVMLETASRSPDRLAVTMGGLEKWWRGGAEQGLSAAELHSQLLAEGFSGVETSTPELDTLPRPYTVIVSRATDERINLLLEPSLAPSSSPSTTISKLVIIAGSSLGGIRLAQTTARLLHPYCQSIVTVQAVEELNSVAMSPGLTALYLADLDRPVFEDLTPESLTALKVLYANSKNILWASRGARGEPYAKMSMGLARAMMVEQIYSDLSVKLVNFPRSVRPNGHLLVDELLRLQIITDQAKENRTALVWTHEPEIEIDAEERTWVARVVPHGGFNNCYNSSRRGITSKTHPSRETVEILRDDGVGSRSLVRVLAPETRRPDDVDVVEVRALYSAPTPLRYSSTQTLYVCIGVESVSNSLVVVLSSSLASIVEVPEISTVPYNRPLDEAPAYLRAITANLLASLICHEADAEACTLLAEPDEDLAEIIAERAAERNLRISCVTSSPNKGSSSSFFFIHAYASSRVIEKALPHRIARIIDFTDSSAITPGSSVLVERLKACVPAVVRTEKADSFHAHDMSPISLLNLLEDAISCSSGVPPSSTDVLSVEDYTTRTHHTQSIIIDWTSSDTISLAVKPSDTLSLLRADRTYLLVGLAGSGGLGLSLAEYLVRLGARYLILTSRGPNVDEQLITDYAAQGVKIQFMANDVTDETALKRLVADVRASWPPIAGVANGAMVLDDVGLQNMSYDQMVRVMKPKVDGSRYLDDIFHDDALDFFVMLSSVSCVHGRSGQANYDAANMYMVGLAEQRRARGVSASVIDIGAIVGTGVIARDVSNHVLNNLVASGYRKMSERDFLTSFANAILVGRVRSGEAPELITGLTIHPRSGSFKPVWSENARFSHLMLNTAEDATSASSSAQIESTQDQLKQAETPDKVFQILQAAILDKLTAMLHLSDEMASDTSSLLQQNTSALGVDSLSAVEIRRWMQVELEIDIPVLKILADVSLKDIVDFAIENLPDALTPCLHSGAEEAVAATEAPTKASIDHSPAAAVKPNIDPFPATLANPSMDTSKPGLSLDPVPPDATASASPLIKAESDTASTSSGSKSQVTPSKSSVPSSIVSSQVLAPKRTVDKVLPMSFGQARFWVMQQIIEDPCAFNISCHIEINAEVDIATFARAVEGLGERHEALRTCFFNEDDHEPMQGIMKESSLRLETISAPTTEVQRYFVDLHKTNFNPSKGELMRAILVSSSPTQHHLLVGYHHINMDSSSFVVLMTDLVRMYAGQKLPPPRLQYPDFALHQLERLRNGHWDTQISYWRNEYLRLPDPLPILSVCANTSRPRPNLTTYSNVSVETRVSAKVARDIQAVCRKVGVTPFHLYATVLRVVLARLSATSDICIGMADANRSEPGASESVGNLLNLLPLRLETNLHQTFASLLKATKNKVLSALSNSSVPFDVILEEVGVERDSTRSPLFQAFVDYRYVNEKLPFDNGYLEGKEYQISKTPYDVMLEMIDTPSGEASLKMLVQESLYSKEEAEILLGCYTNLLNAFAANSEQMADEPSIFDSDKVEDALRIGQGELVDLGNTSFLAEIDETTAIQPTAIALEDSGGNVLRWAEMRSQSVAIGRSLQKLNLPAHSRIGVLQEPTVGWICSMLGIWHAEHTYVPLETTQGIGRLTAVAKEAKLAALVINDAAVPLVSQLGLGEEVPLVNVSALSWTLNSTASSSKLELEDEAMVVYTSGSTGVPKGITIPHRVVVNSLRSLLHRWPMSPQTVLQQTALSFDVSWWGSLLALATKGRVVIAGRDARRDPHALTSLIASKNVTLTFAVPSESVAWLSNGDVTALRESAWTWHFSGGEPYSLNLIRHLQMLGKPSLRAINIYGPTETMIPNAHEVLYREISPADMPVPIGRTMPNYTARVVDDQGHPVPAGISGHLVFGGAGITSGYLSNRAETAERFPNDGLASHEFLKRGWTKVHLSGDRGYLRASDGVLMLQARIDGDTQVKLRGLRIDMMDIEANILSASKGQISDAVVQVRKSQGNDAASQFLVAHVVMTGEARTATEQTAFLNQVVKELRVPDYMRPSVIIAVDSLPLTQHGKVDRKAAARLPLRGVPIPNAQGNHVAGEISGVGGSGTSSQEEKMKELWLNILGESVQTHVLEPDSDFFLVGGNSLLLIRVQGELKRQLGRDVPLVELFQRSSLAHMAALMDDADQEASAAGINWAEEVKLQPDLTHLRATAMSQPSSSGGLVVAITGASGFLGRRILEQLVQSPDIKTVHAMAVRNTKALADMSSSLKLVVHPGDLSRPGLGMTDAAIQQVFSSAHVVIHNGADVSFLKAYSTVRSTNLTSTKDIVRFALQYGSVRHVHYISTAGIATMLSHDLYEEPLGSFPPDSSPEGYVLSKWISELYLERASATTTLPVTIHRPTAIVGPGAPHLDVMSNILHFSEKLYTVPAMKALEGSFQFVGVDEVASGISAAVKDYHSSSPSLVQYRNHNGSPSDTIDIHGLAAYLGRKHNTTLTELSDSEWISKAEAAGMPSEVVLYMQGVNLDDRKGQKWVFPRALKGAQPR